MRLMYMNIVDCTIRDNQLTAHIISGTSIMGSNAIIMRTSSFYEYYITHVNIIEIFHEAVQWLLILSGLQ